MTEFHDPTSYQMLRTGGRRTPWSSSRIRVERVAKEPRVVMREATGTSFDWMDEGLCVTDADRWNDRRMSMCRECPVQVQCGEFALGPADDADWEVAGIAAGMLPGERRSERSRRREDGWRRMRAGVVVEIRGLAPVERDWWLDNLDSALEGEAERRSTTPLPDESRPQRNAIQELFRPRHAV